MNRETKDAIIEGLALLEVQRLTVQDHLKRYRELAVEAPHEAAKAALTGFANGVEDAIGELTYQINEFEDLLDAAAPIATDPYPQAVLAGGKVLGA